MENSITKSNALIEAGYRLSITEMQVVLYGISLINPISNEFPREYKIDIARFAELFDRQHGEIYSDIKDAIKRRFWERDFSYQDENGKTVTCRWLSRIIHEDKSSYIKIKFSEDVQPYLCQLKKNFTTYYISQISKFKSIYSIRLYELSIMKIKQNKGIKISFSLKLEELKEMLDLNDLYSRFYNFKLRVLEPAKKEINKHSDIKFNYEITKEGRSEYIIKFTSAYKEGTKSSAKMISENKIKVSLKTLEEAQRINSSLQARLDIYEVEQQFYQFAQKKGEQITNVDAAFLGFLKKKLR